MADTEEKTIRGTVTRDFNDAGTERSFTKGDTTDFPAGEFENYRVAGLVELVTEDAPAAPAAKAGKASGTAS
ncbi:hypothetical protein [Sphingomonas sp. PP-CE-1G-424]|uniref:hypothetical protein n=1 Tax=Sphingomonas sp. PP-CE-1G-424 TaxID=2135658 RepID=UPI0010560362|nr:hypothetical protein [Sphingomonas sp. PP-CE-1G-424]TCP64143.1 hypothetical protein C8J43_1225 [Sphingomonas sp. PP-CE-1G-424]